MTRKRSRPQHVKIVDFAEQVLHVLQALAPGLVLVGKEILDDVAKAFDADAQSVKCNLRTIAQSAGVQFASGGPAFQRQVLEHRAAGSNTGGAQGKRLAPLAPLLAVEFVECRARFGFLLGLAGLENFEEGVGYGVVLVVIGRVG